VEWTHAEFLLRPGRIPEDSNIGSAFDFGPSCSLEGFTATIPSCDDIDSINVSRFHSNGPAGRFALIAATRDPRVDPGLILRSQRRLAQPMNPDARSRHQLGQLGFDQPFGDEKLGPVYYTLVQLIVQDDLLHPAGPAC